MTKITLTRLTELAAEKGARDAQARIAELEAERDHNWSEYLGERDARMACNMREATWQTRAERAEAALREAALSELAALGQAAEAHDAATKMRAALREIITDATSREHALTIAREGLE